MNIKQLLNENIKDLINYIAQNRKIIYRLLRDKIYLKKNSTKTIEYMNNIRNISSQLTSNMIEKTKIARLLISMIELSNDHREIKTYASEILEIFKHNVKNEIFSEEEIQNDDFDILVLKNNPYYEKLENYSALENLKKFINEEGFRYNFDTFSFPINETNNQSHSKNEKDDKEKFSEETVNTSIEYLQYIQQIETDYLMKKRNKSFDIESEHEKNVKNEVKIETHKKDIKNENPSVKEEVKKEIKKEVETSHKIRNNFKKNRDSPERLKETEMKEIQNEVFVDKLLNPSSETRSKKFISRDKIKVESSDSILDINSKEFDKIRKMTIRKIKNLLKKLIPNDDDKDIQKIAEETEKKIIDNQTYISLSSYDKMVEQLILMLKNDI